MLVVPVPGLWVDGLANASKDTEGAQIVLLDMLMAQTPEKTDGSWCRVELGELVLLNGFPVSRGGGVYRSRLEHGGSDTKSERSVDDVPGEM
jgi:hypothetical protein